MMPTPESGSWTAILTPGDAASLQEAGLVSPPLSDGTRQIHKRRLNRSSDEEESHLPLTVFSIDSSLDCFVSIPENLISVATLKYLGYNNQSATRIWERWSNWPPGRPKRECDDFEDGIPFIEVAEGNLDSASDTCSDDDSAWYHCFDQYGISSELKQAIMDPRFRHIRLTQSCKFWVQDTIKLRHRGLEETQKASHERERERATRREASASGSDILVLSGQRSTSQETAMSAFAKSAASNAPGYTTLYKGLDRAWIQGTPGIRPLFRDDGSVNFCCLTSRSSADFSIRQHDIYFAVDREVAEYYACYSKHRAGATAAVIVQVAIPNSVIESLSPPDIQHVHWPSTEWKSLILSCRMGDKISSQLRKYKIAKLVIGSICNESNLVLANMRSPNEITEKMVYRNRDGGFAVQYVFIGEEGDNLLEEHSKVTVFPLTTMELETWLSDV